MTPRDRTLSIVLVVLITLGGGVLLGYMFIYTPLQQKQTAAATLRTEIDKLDTDLNALNRAKPRVAEAKRESLPADVHLANREYKRFLQDLLLDARITDHKLHEGRALDGRPPVTPEFSAKKPIYSRLEFRVDMNNAHVWQVADFLKRFYEADLLHSITDIKITREGKLTEPRNGLTVNLTIETVLLDGAEQRSSLFPDAPKQGVKLPSPTPQLATKARDYSYLALQDMFYGKLPPPKTEAPFSLSRLSDVVLNKPDEPPTVRVRVAGEGSAGAKLTAKATGSAIPEGELTVDPKTLTITLPKSKEELDSTATTTVSVIATSALGAVQKTSFKVSIGKAPKDPVTPPEPTKLDVASAIKLIGLPGGGDGSLVAIIKDAAGPLKYEITIAAKSVEVTKYWQATSKNWKKDRDYEQPTGVLYISDDYSATKRKFKVITADENSLILLDIGEPDAKPEARQPGKGGGFRPGGGGGFGPPRQGKADPLAVIIGNPATAIPTPVLYRWTLGKSLKELTKLTPDEAKAIMQRVTANGPLPPVVVSSN